MSLIYNRDVYSYFKNEISYYIYCSAYSVYSNQYVNTVIIVCSIRNFRIPSQIEISTVIFRYLAEVWSQVEKSETRQFLQPAQYCASCNQGVMPVLPANTKPKIGAVLAQYSLEALVKLVYYGRSTDYYYWSNTDKWVMPNFGTVLA